MATCIVPATFRLLQVPLRNASSARFVIANAAKYHFALTRAASPSTVQVCNQQLRWRSTAPCQEDYNFEEDLDVHIKDVKDKTFEKITDPDRLKHFRMTQKVKPSIIEDPILSAEIGTATEKDSDKIEGPLPHVIWTDEELKCVKVTHKPPEGIVDNLALYTIKMLRKSFDVISGFNRPVRNEKIWVNRITFLETVAGVPGMVAAMARHLMSLRRMRRDHGWIHTLLEEAENERIHLLTALQLKQPSLVFRGCVVAAQGGFVAFFATAYMISPHYCHRFVGYLEEEAVITYTKCLQDIEHGNLQHWKTMAAPEIARQYWELKPDATMQDVIMNIRADEAHHRIVNHTLGSLKPDDYNPYLPGH